MMVGQDAILPFAGQDGILPQALPGLPQFPRRSAR